MSSAGLQPGEIRRHAGMRPNTRRWRLWAMRLLPLWLIIWIATRRRKLPYQSERNSDARFPFP
jgi:hypothetical protein